MEPTKTNKRGLQDLCLCAFFLAFLLAPAIAFALRGEEAQVNMVENRRPAEFPPAPHTALAWAAWPRAFEAWHDDHFGLRETLVRAHNIVMIWGLETSPSPRVVIGPTHWVYSPAEDLELWRGADPLTTRELESWKKCLEGRRSELEKRGMQYYFVLAPSKAAIYPEFLPSRYRPAGPTRADQLVAYLAANSTFRILDLRAPLLEEKRKDAGDDFIYFPLGTHWSERGVMAGVRAIVAELAKTKPVIATVDDTIEGLTLSDEPGDSWAGRLYLPDLLEQTVRRVILPDLTTRKMNLTQLATERTVIVDQADQSLPRAVVFHDSFGEPMFVKLGRHFSHAVFVWEPGIRIALLEREKPDFVIHVLNDRVLDRMQPQEFNTEGDERLLEQFEASREVALAFDAAANSPAIRAYGDSSVTLRTEGAKTWVACKLDSKAAGFLVPEFKLRRGAHPILHLEFESPISSTTSVFFQERSDPTYNRRRQLHYEIHKGLNHLYVELLEPDLVGQLMFRPASETGTFLISALEVRLVPD